MVQVDLEAAGLPYRDESGRFFDFHSLRHQFLSNLAKAGVYPKVMQVLARHSTITLTLDRDSHVGLYNEVAALDKLPELPFRPQDRETLRATGTEPANANKLPEMSLLVAPPVAPPTCISSHEPAPACTETDHGAKSSDET